MLTRRIVANGFLGTVVLLQLFSEARLVSGDEADKVQTAVGVSPLQQAIESRFGRPDRIIGEGNTLLSYHLENGDTLTFVLAHEKVIGIEHTKKIDLKKAVGKKVTLIGVYNGRAKADDQIVMGDGQSFWLSGRNGAAENGKLVSVTGILKHFPGTNGSAEMQGIPPHYYMDSDSVELKPLYTFTFTNRTQIQRRTQKKE